MLAATCLLQIVHHANRGAMLSKRTAAAKGGKADANPPEDHGVMYSRDLADPDGHLWATFWMNPAAAPGPATT